MRDAAQPTPSDPPEREPDRSGAPWARRNRGAGSLDSAPPYEAPAPPGEGPTLFQRSPFQIGFFMAVGAMVALGLVGVLATLQTIVVLVVLSLFLALGLNPVVEFLTRQRWPRWLAVLVTALVLLAVVGLGAWAIIPVVNDQITNLIRNAPGYLQQLRENPQIAEIDRQFDLINRATAFLTSGSWLSALFGGILGAGRAVANVVFSVVMTIVLTLYFLASLPSIKNTIYQLSPASRRPRVRYLANQMFRRIGGYMSGLFVVMILWGTGSFIVLNIVGLGQYALALATLTALFSAIPVVGSSVGLVACTIVAFSLSPTAGLITLIYFLIYQQMDAYVVQPRVFSRSLNVPAVLVILGAISGGLLLGIIGAVLALPTVASLILLYREVLIPHLDAR